jgi:D-beta-D-heptose 7-phosphate kinase/D-beta-D-heptose 1-phosphate adenosyltransferase
MQKTYINEDTGKYTFKIKEKKELKAVLIEHKKAGKKAAFTNGCFDLLHTGHIRYLYEAKKLADILVIAINSDESVRKIKGDKRPLIPESERAEILAALEFVDYVVIFNETDPHEIISYLTPDILVKGADWGVNDIIGRDVVERSGGRVERIKLTEGASTTNIVDLILKRYGK